jgi:phosphoserine phosphatase
LPPIMANASKASWIRSYAEKEGLSLSACYCYTDSISDLPMLSVVGHPTAVHPDFRLKSTAISSHWPILDLR